MSTEIRDGRTRDEPSVQDPARLEYQRLYLPPGTDRRTAQTVLTLHAEFGEWELDRLRLLPDGSRRVVLRRRRRGNAALPSYLPT